jgi:hypothetical protein
MRRKRTARAKLRRNAYLAGTALALVLSTCSPVAVMAGPNVLTESQMDGVTAGGIRVDAIAFARASGHYAIAQGRSYALASTVNDRIGVGVGFAEGLAFACCSRQSEVAVYSTVTSTGQIVHSATYAFKFRGAIAGRADQVSYFAYGYTAAFLLALSFDERFDPGPQTVRESWDHLGGSISRLIDIDQVSVRDGIVTGFEFAPVFTVGLRWHVFRDFLATTPTGSTPSVANLR